MFCKNCGAKLKDDDKFCTACGSPVADTPVTGVSPTYDSQTTQSVIVNTIFTDCKNILRTFFSKNPLAAIQTFAHENHSHAGIVIAILNVTIFAFAACINVTSLINFLISGILDGVRSILTARYATDLIAMFNQLPTMHLPVQFSWFIAFLLFGLLYVVIEAAAIYILLKLRKQPTVSVREITNVVAISALPLTLGMVVNIVVGFVYPPLTLAISISTFLIHIVFMYEGIKELNTLETEPIGAYSILLIAASIIVLVICILIVNKVMANVSVLIQGKLSALEYELSNMFDYY